jgi:hypothetical protein
MVPSWVQWTGALGSIAIALLAFITLVYSERFRNWTRRLRKPTPVLAEAWIEQRTGPLRFFLHLGLSIQVRPRYSSRELSPSCRSTLLTYPYLMIT